MLVLAGLLFVPAILTPVQKTIDNPNFNVSVKPDTSQPVMVTTMPNTKSSEKPLVQLESVESQPEIGKEPTKTAPITTPENLVAGTQPSKSATAKPMVAIKLESLGDAGGPQKPVVRPANENNPALKKRESWVRVGSFSNLANADKLAAELKDKKYSVKIENTKVSGKPYRRVLIGPFSSSEEMRKVLDQIRLDGFSPSIQR